MDRLRRNAGNRLGLSHRGFEWLESRSLLSQGGISLPTDMVIGQTVSLDGLTSQVAGPVLGDALSVVTTSPAAGDVLTQEPTALTLSFDRPVDPFSLTFDVA